MSFALGKSQYFTFKLLNLTNSLASEVKLTTTAGEVDQSTIGNNWKAFDQALAEANIAVSGVWDDGTAATSLDTVMHNAINAGGTGLFEYCPAGSATNRIKYNGNAFCTSYERGGAVADKVGFSAALRVAGSITRSTLA